MKYSVKCSCCQRAIQETDWVRKAKQHVYHLACFACEVCKRQLSTGEEFALIDHKLLCKLHYIEKLESPSTPGASTVVPVVLNSSGNESDISSHGSSIRDSMMVEGRSHFTQLFLLACLSLLGLLSCGKSTDVC